MVLMSKQRWQTARLVALVAVIVTLAALVIVRPAAIFGDPELREIARKRAMNLARASTGMALPGTPDLKALDARLKAHALTLGAPVLIRVFKREFELEVWLARDGRYHKFETYPICRWSGQLGPKLSTGDRQAPEGFYTVSADQLNPDSRWHRSFNLGFPNAFDRSHGRTGSALMVHGGCSSVGCYAMTNGVVDELWRLVTASLAGAQKRFQVQVFPFRMSDAALDLRKDNVNIPFWRSLKVGSDIFERTLLPPVVTACRGVYRFEAASSGPEKGAPVNQDCATHRSGTIPQSKKVL
jgi:murein L,D-transpeptidase YafK